MTVVVRTSSANAKRKANFMVFVDCRTCSDREGLKSEVASLPAWADQGEAKVWDGRRAVTLK